MGELLDILSVDPQLTSFQRRIEDSERCVLVDQSGGHCLILSDDELDAADQIGTVRKIQDLRCMVTI